MRAVDKTGSVQEENEEFGPAAIPFFFRARGQILHLPVNVSAIRKNWAHTRLGSHCPLPLLESQTAETV